MATSSVSSGTTSAASAAASAAATNRANAQQIMTSLGAGSGVDVASLAKSLVEAERLPKETEINNKISKNEKRISGYSAIMFMMTELKNSFSALKDRDSFNTLTASNSNTSAFSVTPSATALTGTHDVEVLRLAKSQRTVSAGVASATASLNGGRAMSLNLTVGPSANVTPTVVTTQGQAPVTETSLITFQDLAVGESVTVGGLTYTASSANTAQEVATAFANLNAGDTSGNSAKGGFTGALAGFGSAAASNNQVLFTSTSAASNVTDLSFSSSQPVSLPSATVTQGVTAANETSLVTFKDMVAGQTVTVAGLTYTSTGATTAAQVAQAFASAAANSTPTNPSTGTFSGTLTGFSSAASNGANLTFTSTTAGSNVTDIAVSGATKRLQLAAGKDTPQDIVAAINASGTTVKAQLVNTGDGSANPFQIVLTGATGASNVFGISANYGTGNGSPGVSFPAGLAANQAAEDAQIKVNGITYTRASNSITDAVQGLTIDLKATTSSSATVTLNRDTAPIKDKIKALVTAYKDTRDILTEVSNSDSTLDTYGATLVGDSTVNAMRQQLRSMFSGNSSTPGSTVGALWQMGIKIDEKGVMSLDETKLDTVLKDNFDDVVKSFTGGYNNLGAFSTLSAGYAGDAVKKLNNIIGAKGALTTNTATANQQNTKYKEDLTKLQTRMDSLLQRYTKQFGVMESLVGQTNSMKTSLKSSFEGLMAMYTNK
jgi:flagellar hook-associated protein 2